MSTWTQFRRLLLGTAVESLLAEGVQVEFSTLSISFDEDSEFRVPRLNNYMRFKGQLSADLTQPTQDAAIDRIAGSLRKAWPELLKVVDIPIGDRLTQSRNEVSAVLVPGDGDTGQSARMEVRFDLIAD